MPTGRRLATIVLCLGLAGCAGSPPAPVEVAVPVAPPAERGKASFYHDRFHGRQTANGEHYDREALTAAHRTLPFGTVVQVTNLENGKSIVLRVNDRGPFVRGRVIDVSRRAARELGFLRKGVVDAEVEVLERPPG
ncbi:MAG: septal ring lytic transglycosylase RlpA family protein [bacterium]